jgi:F420-dependent oxidoreductase-like protein
MRLGLNVGYSGARMRLDMNVVTEADRLGLHSLWSAEAYGSDAVVPLAYIAARTERIHLASGIMQMPARTPAMTAMTAMTLDHLSGGRFICGLGVSGPQVVEGWHGVRYGKPLVRTREYVEILRAIWAREQPLEHHGEHYDIPYRGAGASGLGKPLKSILHGRPIPIYLAAIGPKSVAQAAEIADGWLPIFYSPYRAPKVYQPSLDDGFARAGGGKSTKTFDIAVTVTVVVGDDVQACLDRVKPQLALYIGGMGARGKNFYNDLACRAWLRGRGEAHPGPVPRRPQGRGDGRGAERTRRRGRALRPAGAHPRPARGVARVARRHDDPRGRPARGRAHDGRARAVESVFTSQIDGGSSFEALFAAD